MKKFAGILIALSLMSLSVAAQQTETEYPIKVGPIIGINAAMNTVDYHVSDAERSISAGSLLGVISEIPFNSNTSAVVVLGYYTLSFSDENNWVDIDYAKDLDQRLANKLTTEGSFNYIALGTLLNVGYFTIGFNFGIPVGAQIKNKSASSFPITFGKYSINEDISPTDDDRKFMIEGRIGGLFPIKEFPSGTLQIGISGGYTFTEMTKSAGNHLPQLDKNFRLPNLMMTLSYVFNL